MNAPDALYVHIPFCSAICRYCDFPKVLYKKEWAEDYLSALFRELEEKKIGMFSTIYVGGGTPTSLSVEQLRLLLARLKPHLKEGGEWTVEGNPDSIDEEKAKILSSFGVNRVSIGLQSSKEKFLRMLGRTHRFEDAKKAVAMLRSAGITNINLDLMFALPRETVEEAVEDAEVASSLGVPHLSCYSLILEEGTAFYASHVEEASQEEAAEQYEAILKTLRAKGYARYEVSNFAIPGNECRHNLVYWRNEPYEAIGLGAAFYKEGKRGSNTRSLSRYLRGMVLEKEEAVPKEEEEDYFLMTNLRLADGFEEESFARAFGGEELNRIKARMDDPKIRGLLIEEDGRIRPSDRGILLLDLVLTNL